MRFVLGDDTFLASLLSAPGAKIVYFNLNKGRKRLDFMQKDVGGCNNQLVIAAFIAGWFHSITVHSIDSSKMLAACHLVVELRSASKTKTEIGLSFGGCNVWTEDDGLRLAGCSA